VKQLSRSFLCGVVCLVGLAAGCTREVPPSAFRETSSVDSNRDDDSTLSSFLFVDRTADSGVKAIYHNGEDSQTHSIVESLGGGVGLLDYDLDGRWDLLFPGGGRLATGEPLQGLPMSVWRNLGEVHFEDVSTNVSQTDPTYYSHGCAAADVDNDGWVDVLITGYGGVQFFRNQGDGTFLECAAVLGLIDPSWSTSAAWADFDQDGDLDLYVTHYVDWSWENHPQCPTTTPGVFDVCTPGDFHPLPDTMFINNGDGTFGGKPVAGSQSGKGLGVMAVDLNNDSQIDIYVANDTTTNFLFVNDGAGDFQDAGLISGAGVDGNGTANGSMGLATLDFDGNLLPDLWVTNYENETYALYENGGNTSFLWATERAGLNALGKLFVGFGTVAADWDSDGDEDIVVANGHVMLHPANSQAAQQSVLLANTPVGNNRRLLRQSFAPDSYFSAYHRGRGVVYGDLDRDGDLDLVFSNTNEPAAILINESPAGGRLLTVKMIGKSSNRDAIGAKAVLETTQHKLLAVRCRGGQLPCRRGAYEIWSGESREGDEICVT
jgi:hypothetical protein